VVSFGVGVAPHLNGVLPPSAPADEAAARQNQAGKASTGDRPRDTDSNIEIELRKQNIRIGEEAIWLGYCRDIYIPEPQIIVGAGLPGLLLASGVYAAITRQMPTYSFPSAAGPSTGSSSASGRPPRCHSRSTPTCSAMLAAMPGNGA
jgi:hypothetical protein